MEIRSFSKFFPSTSGPPFDAAHMMLRSSLMMAISAHIRRQGWKQSEAASRLGVTQPRISDLTRGKVSLFGLDILVTMASAAGLRVDIVVKEAP